MGSCGVSQLKSVKCIIGLGFGCVILGKFSALDWMLFKSEDNSMTEYLNKL